MATFKRLTTIDATEIWINLDLVQAMSRLSADEYKPDRTWISFGGGEDGEYDREEVLESPATIVG